MRLMTDCLPCVLRQAVEVSRTATDDEKLQQMMLDESISLISRYREYKNPVEIGRDLHQIVKRLSGLSDPYYEIKKENIKDALKVYPYLKSFLQNKSNDIIWALKIAATGNFLDSSINADLDVEKCIEQDLEQEFAICDAEELVKKIKISKNMLIIGDNAGETVFDRVFAETLSGLDVTYAVRSEPIINDTTLEEAYITGINACTKVISTGCNAPGILLHECSKEFLDTFYNADIVIAKGQGNFESLSGEKREIFFLLKAKCVSVAGAFGVNLNDYVFKHNNKK